MLLDRLQDCKRVVRRKQYLRAAARKERIVKDRGSVGQWSDDEMDWRLIELEQGINRRDDGFERSVRVYGALRFAGSAAGTGYRDSVLHLTNGKSERLVPWLGEPVGQRWKAVDLGVDANGVLELGQRGEGFTGVLAQECGSGGVRDGGGSEV